MFRDRRTCGASLARFHVGENRSSRSSADPWFVSGIVTPPSARTLRMTDHRGVVRAPDTLPRIQ